MTHPHEPRTTDLLRQALAANGERITLEQFLAPLGERSYGFLLLLLALPNFIPLPLGGVMGLLIVLVGLQMLLGLPRPWLPRRAREHAFARSSVEHFLARMTPLFVRLERVCSPRLEQLTRRPFALLTGALLVLVGLLLSLPIPFTNYLFGLIVLLFAVALVERDGALLLGLWIVALVVAVAAVHLGGAALEWWRLRD
ncbi:MAG TPA: exopolysaccharide biosynthesis protein [Rhodanobacteraceae bacterium]|nr:exopolysaccharide biosynthesis protein [Rhodanobacteraceae bacterium]